ncbi:hypothetical protein B0H19DRAFT_1264213 [Mycena capillaripes]|nr:hypothetical protein B0H19DRAFT_1264213 [Mycena capillaripes]
MTNLLQSQAAATPDNVAAPWTTSSTAAAQPIVAASPGSAAHAFHMLSVAANALAAAAPAETPVGVPAPAPTGIQYHGPWVASAIYDVIPTGPLATVPDNGEKWYAITKGRYIGVTNSTAIADNAVTHVSHALRTSYSSQVDAVRAFNDALALNIGLIEVI